MKHYLLGSLTKSLYEPAYIPIGIIIWDGDVGQARVIEPNDIPASYKPDDEIGKAVLNNLAEIFKNTTEVSLHPTNLFFTEIRNIDMQGTLEEQADKLFEKHVLSHYCRFLKHSTT